MVQLLESKHHQAIYYLVDHLDYLCNDHLFAGHISIIPNERQTVKQSLLLEISIKWCLNVKQTQVIKGSTKTMVKFRKFS